MTLAEQQRILARLYTNRRAREQWSEAPATVARELGLDTVVEAEWAKLRMDEVDAFARSLERKRRGDVSRYLPSTARVLGRRFEELFGSYSESIRPAGCQPIRKDAEQFAAFLQRELARMPSPEARLGAEVARYEASRLLATQRRWLVRKIRFDVRALGQADFYTATAGASERGLGKSSWVVWFRLLPRGRLRQFVW